MTKYQNDIQDRRITSLEDKFSKMCDNHAHDISGIKVDIASITATQKVILSLIVLIFGSLVGLFFRG